MHPSDTSSQARVEQVNVRLSKDEKDDVRLVSAIDQTTEAELLRAALPGIRERAQAIRAAARAA